tara:strand:+ start:278 stop:667 length:390 start_codon:yes stop_codon:yes gene_type:complete
MLLVLSVLSMVLRSAFHLHDIDVSSGAKQMIAKKLQYNAEIFDKDVLPSVLLYADDAHTDTTWFLHYNYTIFECIWGTRNISIEYKTRVFNDMTSWLNTYNHTLNGRFSADDDYLAWNIAQYGVEFYFD